MVHSSMESIIYILEFGFTKTKVLRGQMLLFPRSLSAHYNQSTYKNEESVKSRKKTLLY